MSRQVVVDNFPHTPARATAGIRPEQDPGSSAAQPGIAAEPALQVVDLTKSFRSGFARREIRGIEGVSFTVARGEVFALLGHNGAGKTTTIGCLLDLVRPERGEVKLLGRDHRDRTARTRVGYLPERPYFFDYLTGRELLEFYADLQDIDRRERAGRIDEVLRQVDMFTDAGRRLNKYSKGMLQRLGLAQALLGDPELLILDEPMSGLDPMGRLEVRSLLLGLKKQGRTILLSSHIVPDVEQLADAVGILRDGRLVLNQRLGSLADACSYRVRAGAPAATVLAAAVPLWAMSAVDPASAGAVTDLSAADPRQLRELLDACERAGLPVLAVDSQRSGLEDLFLTTHRRGGEA